MKARWILALITACCMALSACGGSQTVIDNEITVPDNRFIPVPSEMRSEVDDASGTINDPSADRLARAEAYLLIADSNLAMFDALRDRSESEDIAPEDFRDIISASRTYFMQAYRAKARSWAARVEDSLNTREHDLEQRFADAWDRFENPQKAYEALSSTLADAITLKKDKGVYIPVDFLSDLRYSTAVFYTLLEKPGDDMQAFLDITGNEAEAVRFAGDVAFLYANLSTKPQNAAATYRALAQNKPTTREGFEAQVSVLESLKKQRRIGVMESGDEDAFDTSEKGIELFRTVNKDLSALVEMNAHKETWATDEESASSNLEVRSEDLVRSFTLRMHGLAQKNENSAFYEMAANAYRQYHTLFPGSPFRYEMLFFNAEALYEMGRYDDAYNQYKAALGQNSRGKFREDVYRALVLAAYKRGEDHPLPKTPSDAPIEMPGAHRDFIGSGEQFIAQMSEDDPDMAGFVRYEIIRRHYLYGEWRAAETLMEEFVKYKSSHASAPKAAVLWLDLLAREAVRGGDRDDLLLQRTIDKFYANPSLLKHDIVKAKLEEVSKQPPVISGTLPE